MEILYKLLCADCGTCCVLLAVKVGDYTTELCKDCIIKREVDEENKDD